jgi:membrane protease YdiL (CAAX protease family)
MRIQWTIAVYSGLLLAALVWGALRGQPNIFWPVEAPLPAYFGLPMGLFLALGVHGATRWSIRVVPLMRELAQEFKSLLGPMRRREIFIVAICSSVGEEALFRAAMQPSAGLFVTGLVFGLMHFGPIGRFSVWTVSAVGMGYALGGIYWLTGDLFGVIAAHFVVNYLNLNLIRGTDFGISDPIEKLKWPKVRRSSLPADFNKYRS